MVKLDASNGDILWSRGIGKLRMTTPVVNWFWLATESVWWGVRAVMMPWQSMPLKPDGGPSRGECAPGEAGS